MRVAILDDELHCVESLVLHLQSLFPEIQVVYKSTQVLDALEAIQNTEIDLLFLDIEMPNMNGFEFLKQLKPLNFDVIFTTAYSQYAIEAFKAQAVNYLLKPIDEEELKTAVLQYRSNKTKSKSTQDNLELFLSEFVEKNTMEEKIAIPVSDGIEFINVKNIVYCTSESNYSIIILDNNKKITYSKTLKNTESILSKHGFLRIHQSYLINPIHLKKYIRKAGGYVIMSNNEKLPISNSKKTILMEYLERL